MNIKVLKISTGFIIATLNWSLGAAAEGIVVEAVGFATPESVEYYAAEDVYLVTNINGSPFAADDNGFISKIGPEGKVLDLKWIDGSLIMSSWEDSAVYRLDKNGSYSTVADSLESPSDIGYDNKQNRILVPLFLKDKVVFLPL